VNDLPLWHDGMARILQIVKYISSVALKKTDNAEWS
jgi:hypothetical protein